MKGETQTTDNTNVVSTNSMNIFDNRYYTFNKRMLCIIGQWPYQSDLEKRTKFLLLSLLSLSLIVPQVRAMMETWGKLDKFIECFSPLITHVACDMKLINIMLHQEELKNLLDKMRHDWEGIRNSAQVDIIKERGEKGRRWSIVWFCQLMKYNNLWRLKTIVEKLLITCLVIATVYVLLCGSLCLAMMSKILYGSKLTNHSRATFDVIPVDYGIDPVKYWWPVQMHMWVCLGTVLLIMPAFDTLYMILAQHVCAMFEILRYNLDNMLEDNKKIAVVLTPDYKADFYYRRIVSSIKKHSYLIEYIKDIESTYEICMFVVLGFNMIDLSVTGYQAVMKGRTFEDTIRFLFFTISVLVHLFVVTLPGHWIMSCSAFFSDSVYNCKWYMMSLRSRKLMILPMRASIEPCTLTVGKIYVMSVQNFCAVLRTSMSYLAVLTSMH